MRLSEYEKTAIREVIHSFDPESKIYLFGSRADDRKKGGDIDLLLISKKITNRDKRRIRLGLYDRMGEQKIDIIISDTEESSPFVRIAHEEGVLL